MRGITCEQPPKHGAWDRVLGGHSQGGGDELLELTTGVLECDRLQQKEFHHSIRDFEELEKSSQRGKKLHSQKISYIT